jgi:hypothetical protein
MRRALRPVFLACSGLVIGFAIAGTVVTGARRSSGWVRSQEERWPSTWRFATPHRGTSRSGGWEKKANVERPRRCVSSPVASGKPGTICPVEATHTASSVAAICLRYGVFRTGISVRTSFVWKSIRATAPDSPLRCNPTHADSAPTATPPIGWSTSGSASGMSAVIRGSPVSEAIGLGCPEGVSSAAGVGSGRKAPMANTIAEVGSRSAEVETRVQIPLGLPAERRI